MSISTTTDYEVRNAVGKAIYTVNEAYIAHRYAENEDNQKRHGPMEVFEVQKTIRTRQLRRRPSHLSVVTSAAGR